MSNSYWVIAHDGTAYGPADVAALGQWALEGRLTSQSTLQDATTNARLTAGQVPRLAAVFARGAGPAVGYQQPVGHQQSHAYQQPAGYQQQQTAFPGAIPMAGACGLSQAATYQRPAAAPYEHPQQPIGYQQRYYPMAVPAGAAAHELSGFSPGLVLLFHVLKLGVFSFVHFQLMHGRLPKLRPDDPSAGKAIGFMFIPVFNLYWVFFANLRLIDRIDEQRRFAGLPPTDARGLFITTMVLLFIPCVNLAGLVVFLVYLARLQVGVNELVQATRGPTA